MDIEQMAARRQGRMTAVATLDAIGKRRRRLEAEQTDLRRQMLEAVAAGRDSGIGVSEIARRLKITRAAVYTALDEVGWTAPKDTNTTGGTNAAKDV